MMYKEGDEFRGTWPALTGRTMKIVGVHTKPFAYYEVTKSDKPGKVFRFSARIFERSTLITYKKI